MELNFGENIKNLRREQNLTQQELADIFGVSFQAVSKWERGEAFPDITLLPEISNFFAVSIDDLLGVNKLKNEQKIGEYLKLYEQMRIKYRAAVFQSFQKAVKEFPNDFRILIRYMELLREEKDSVFQPEYDKTSKELFSIYERIQNNCTDDSIRIWSKHIICEHLMYKYDCLGHSEEDRQSAESIINTLPSLKDSREYVFAMYSDVPKWYETRENAIEELLYLLQNTVIGYCYYDGKFSPEYKINIIKHINGLFKIVDRDGKYSKNRIHLIYNYGHLGHLYYETGDSEKALKYLKTAAEYAKKFDEDPDKPENIYRFYETESQYAEMNMCQRMKTLMTQHYNLPEKFKKTDDFKSVISILE